MSKGIFSAKLAASTRKAKKIIPEVKPKSASLLVANATNKNKAKKIIPKVNSRPTSSVTNKNRAKKIIPKVKPKSVSSLVANKNKSQDNQQVNENDKVENDKNKEVKKNSNEEKQKKLAQQALSKLEFQLLVLEQDILISSSSFFACLIELVSADHCIANLLRIHWLRKISINLSAINRFNNSLNIGKSSKENANHIGMCNTDSLEKLNASHFRNCLYLGRTLFRHMTTGFPLM